MAKQTGRSSTGRSTPRGSTSRSTVRRPAFLGVLESEQVRRIGLENRTLYAVPDVVKALTHADRPMDYWESLARRESALAEVSEFAPFTGTGGAEELLPAADLPGILRIIESIGHPRAEGLKRWLAACAAARLEEADNPELAIARARHEYERRGYPRQWIDQRLRSISGRAEIVGEWARRGAQASDDYRALTNVLLQDGFGMDAETYRQHKGLFGRENLRDHMSEMELALLSLGETVAASLHRSRGSKSLPELEKDLQQAGKIVAGARRQIEDASGANIIAGDRKTTAERRNPGEPATPNSETQRAGRQVIYRKDKAGREKPQGE